MKFKIVVCFCVNKDSGNEYINHYILEIFRRLFTFTAGLFDGEDRRSQKYEWLLTYYSWFSKT